MIETQLNAFDISVLAVVGISTLFAFFRGFVRELLSLGAWVGAGLITIYYFPDAARWLQPKFKNPMIAVGFATLGLYIGSLIIFAMINMLIMKFVKSGEEIGMLDNLFGLVFGAARGAFIVSLGFLVVTMAMNQESYPDWLKTAHTRPYVERGAMMLASISPKYMQEITSLKNRAQEPATAEWLRGVGEGPARDESGYDNGQQKELQQLLDNVEKERNP